MSAMLRLRGAIGLFVAAAFSLLCGASCKDDDGDDQIDPGDTIYVFVWPEHPQPTSEALEEVGGMFGMEVVQSDTWVGAIALYYTEHFNDTEAEGYATSVTCSPHIVMFPTASVRILAHEIGHTLGLNHVDDPNNLMASIGEGVALTDEQVDEARLGSGALEYCRELGEAAKAR